MRSRMAGKIAVGVIIIVFAVLAVIYALNTREADKLHHGFRAVTSALVALTAATCYRYFED